MYKIDAMQSTVVISRCPPYSSELEPSSVEYTFYRVVHNLYKIFYIDLLVPTYCKSSTYLYRPLKKYNCLVLC